MPKSKPAAAASYERYKLSPAEWALMISESWLADTLVEVGKFSDENADFLAWKALAAKSKHPSLLALVDEVDRAEENFGLCVVRGMQSEFGWTKVEQVAWQQKLRWDLVKSLVRQGQERVEDGDTKAWPATLSIEVQLQGLEITEVPQGQPPSALHGKIRRVDREEVVAQLQELQELQTTTQTSGQASSSSDPASLLNEQFIQRAMRFVPAPRQWIPEPFRAKYLVMWIGPSIVPRQLPLMGVDVDGWFRAEQHAGLIYDETKSIWERLCDAALLAWEASASSLLCCRRERHGCEVQPTKDVQTKSQESRQDQLAAPPPSTPYSEARVSRTESGRSRTCATRSGRTGTESSDLGTGRRQRRQDQSRLSAPRRAAEETRRTRGAAP